MSNLQDFADHTYRTSSDLIQQSLEQTPDGGNTLIIIGEDHYDTETEQIINDHIPAEEQTPAVAAAFTEISMIHAAIEAVGKENVILSIEYPTEFGELVAKDQAQGCETLITHTQEEVMKGINHATTYACTRGIQTVGSDPLHGEPSFNQPRDDAQIKSLMSLSSDGHEGKKVVIHVGGSAHLMNLAGYTDEEVVAAKGTLVIDPARNPFTNGAYDSVAMINTAFRSPTELRVLFDRLSKSDDPDFTRDASLNITEFTTYLSNESILQMGNPGRITEAEAQHITTMVEAAAEKHKAGAQSAPAIEASEPAPDNANDRDQGQPQYVPQ